MSEKTLRCHAKRKFATSCGKDQKSELRFKYKTAREIARSHQNLCWLFGGTDDGCLQAAVASKK